MKVFDNEIFYLLNVEKQRKEKISTFNYVFKIIIENLHLILFIPILIFLKTANYFFRSPPREVIWFSTGKKSNTFFNRYIELGINKPYLIRNEIFGTNGIVLNIEKFSIKQIILCYLEIKENFDSLIKKEQIFNLQTQIKYIYKSFYLSLLSNLILNSKIKEILITEKESSWGQLIFEDAKLINAFVKVIPHGVEYNYKLPLSYPGHKFYCTTSEAAHQLNSLYGTNKFVYDDKIVREVMKFSITQKVYLEEVVYFPEGRNIKVDKLLIEEIIRVWGKPSLCIHPLDKKSNYDQFNLKILPFDKAINQNIVISRNSTVLLEALAYKSLPISLICNKDDLKTKKSIPSLNIKEIVTINSIIDLKFLIENITMNKEQSRKKVNESIN